MKGPKFGLQTISAVWQVTAKETGPLSGVFRENFLEFRLESALKDRDLPEVTSSKQNKAPLTNLSSPVLVCLVLMLQASWAVIG